VLVLQENKEHTENRYTLDQLAQGDRAVLCRPDEGHPLFERLLDLGWTQGTPVECVRESPLGDPVAYAVRGSVIALRRQDARQIEIEQVQWLPRTEKGKAQGVIALAGNPNVGKSTLFNALTGLHQHTGNWTGKTVSCAKGRFRHAGECYTLIDLPGMYSMHPHAAEEQAAYDALVNGEADAVGIVCDAGALERNLILTLQIMQLVACPVLVILNLQDEARRRGVLVSVEKLQEMLGVPVVATEARSGKGIERVSAALADLCREKQMLEGRQRLLSPNAQQLSAEMISQLARDIASQVCEQLPGGGDGRDRKLDRVLTGRLVGFVAMLSLLAVLLWVTMVGANGISDQIMALFSWLEGLLDTWMTAIGAPEWLIGSLLYGVFRTVGWVVSVMLPPMAIFFPLFTILEDFGYLPRIAFNLDRGFCRCRACGKQALTMCMGLGCNAVGVMGCRIIDSPRERRIAMLTNSMMPCNGRFPTLIALIGMFVVTSGGVWGSLGSALTIVCGLLLCVGGTLLCSRLLSMTLLRGEASSFVLELPPYRIPRIGQVLVRSALDRTLFVLGRAVAVAAPAGLLLWLLANIYVGDMTLLAAASSFLDPVGRALGMDGVILLAFVLALPANEIFVPIIIMIYRAGAVLEPMGSIAGVRDILVAQGWTTTTAICVMLFLLFHWPCSTTIWTIKKESGGWRWAILGVLLPTLVGAVLCFVVASLSRLLT
jgi:ferrous iron transport protein B